jgi:hypothetical protein
MQGGQLNTRAAATFSTATKTAAAQIQKHPLHQAAHNECWHHDEVPNTPDVPAATVFPQAGGGSICCLLEKQTHRPAQL